MLVFHLRLLPSKSFIWYIDATQTNSNIWVWMLIYGQYTHFFWRLRLLFISLVLRGCFLMDGPLICFTAVTWNPHGFVNAIFSSMLLHGHFPMSDIYIWLPVATKTLSYGWNVCLKWYCNTYSSPSQNPIITSLLPNVPSYMSEK